LVANRCAARIGAARIFYGTATVVVFDGELSKPDESRLVT